MRCLIVDRPGTGLSEPLSIDIDVDNLERFAETLIVDILDALGIERSHVVASSFGGYVALRTAAKHPERLERMVQMACPAFARGMLTPAFMRFLRIPGVRQLLAVLPPNRRANEMILRQIGHGASLRASRISRNFLDWYLALQRYTNTNRNEMRMIAALQTRGGFDPSLTLEDDLLRDLQTPTYFIWGEDDGFGGVEVARRMVDLMPNAELEMIPGAGHLPWLDYPEAVAKLTQSHLTG